MIYQFYPHPKSKPKVRAVTVQQQQPQTHSTGAYPLTGPERYEIGDVTRAKTLGISNEEFSRRCYVVREHWRKCFLNVGDTVYPVNKEDYEKQGPMKVVSLESDYRNMINTEWPANDNPFILALQPLNGEGMVFATSGWATKHNQHLNITGAHNGQTTQTC